MKTQKCYQISSDISDHTQEMYKGGSSRITTHVYRQCLNCGLSRNIQPCGGWPRPVDPILKIGNCRTSYKKYTANNETENLLSISKRSRNIKMFARDRESHFSRNQNRKYPTKNGEHVMGLQRIKGHFYNRHPAPHNTTQFLIQDYRMRYNSVYEDKFVDLSLTENISVEGDCNNCDISIGVDRKCELCSRRSTGEDVLEKMPLFIDEEFQKKNFEESYFELNDLENRENGA